MSDQLKRLKDLVVIFEAELLEREKKSGGFDWDEVQYVAKMLADRSSEDGLRASDTYFYLMNSLDMGLSEALKEEVAA